MAIDNTQLRVERSIFEVIRLILVKYGYLPDITSGQYPNTPTGNAQWETDLKTVESTKGFAAEVFGHSSNLSKGLKRVPRIAIIPRRIMPGDIGANIAGGFRPDPTDPDKTQRLKPSLQSTNFHLDINIVSGKSAQDRLLHEILAEALKTWTFIPLFDSPTEQFFIRQFNYYDLPDNAEGIEEKVYSYEVPDLYLYEGDVTDNIPHIENITLNITQMNTNSILLRDGSIIGPYFDGDVLYMDLSGIHHNLPT